MELVRGFIFFALPAAVLATLPAAVERSAKVFAVAFAKSLFLIVVPVWAFLVSCLAGWFFEGLSWKGNCTLGWITCFHSAKIWLLPFVAWALVALYRCDILRIDEERWVTWGVSFGAVLGTFCLIHALLTVPLRWWLLIPFYVSAWFVFRTIQLIRAGLLTPLGPLWATLCAAPGWIASLYYSYATYQSLPETPPDCFIVTAAARGHHTIVGPRRSVVRNGRRRDANSQLIAFWELEQLWRSRLPRSHRTFRACYNRIGPVIARCVCGPFLADAVYLLLKPAEWGVRVVLWWHRRLSLRESSAAPSR